MTSGRSLTREEAEARARLVAVDRYEIDVDTTDLLEGDELRAVSTIRFSCREPGASTFVECAAEVVSAILNGVTIEGEAIEDDRIRLGGLEAANTLVVESVQRSTHQGAGVHRAVDPADGEVYVWTSFEPDDARLCWACFDQPDLKAPFAFTVAAPAPWTVTSNSGDPIIVDLPGVRRWAFPDTPPLSTYVPVVNAGPFHEVRAQRDGHDLGLFARRSLAAFVDRDAEELFDLTAAGLRFFGERFGMPFPQRKYDQVFAPEMGGAMENYGCVTWSDAFVYRTEPSYEERQERALVLLHEMAHMWFGDMVTMRWWDDLWLNEAFAEWACCWAATAATPFTDAWPSFLAGAKLSGYRADMAPTTHPIRQPVRDVAEAAASFDAITYPKGASVLKQLVAYVGEDDFVRGLRSYFAKHAWANTTLLDLIGELSDASGRDLFEWTRGWLDTAGTDRLELVVDAERGLMMKASGPNGGPPRPHRLGVGVYDRRGDGLLRRELLSLEISEELTDVDDPGPAHLLLVNDEDLTFASTRPDPASRSELLASAAELPTAVARAVAVTTAWDMLATAEIATAQFVECVLGVLPRETSDTVVEPFLHLALAAAERWASEAERDRLLGWLADTCLALADAPARRLVALRAAAQSAVSQDHIARLRSAVGNDVDLRWRVLTRLAELGRLDRGELDELSGKDPDPDSWVRRCGVEAAQPDADAKQAAWAAVVEERMVPVGSIRQVALAFWRPSQPELLAPYAEKYLALLPTLDRTGMIAAMAISGAMFPLVGTGPEFVGRAREAAQAPGVTPLVSRRVLEQSDLLRRMLIARGGG